MLFYTSKLILYVNDQRVIEKQEQVRGVASSVASMVILQTFIRATTRKILVTFCVVIHYPLSYGVPVRERYGSTLLPATREQHDQNCTQSH